MTKRNYILKVLVLAALMTFVLSGCVAVGFTDGIGQNGSINGKGEMETVEYAMSDYTEVRVDANVAIVYTAAASDIVKVEAQKNLLEHLLISSENGILRITSDKNLITDKNKTPVIHIFAPALSRLEFTGLVQIKDSDPITSNKLHLLVDGSLSGNLVLDTEKLTVEVNGTADMTLSGSASIANITVDGAGTLNALELETKDSSVELSGSGDISLSCSDTLNIQIDGAGNITYRGAPSVQQQIDGAGNITQVK